MRSKDLSRYFSGYIFKTSLTISKKLTAAALTFLFIIIPTAAPAYAQVTELPDALPDRVNHPPLRQAPEEPSPEQDNPFDAYPNLPPVINIAGPNAKQYYYNDFPFLYV